MLRIKQTLFLVVLSLFLLTHSVSAEKIHIAVASNFSAPMKTLAADFEKSTGHRLLLSYGSSGKFYAQIKHGAPFQIFFSADQSKPQALVAEGYGVSASRFTYAIGALALWSADDKFITDGAPVLQNKQFRKLALANPKLAPYGQAAIEALKHLQLINSTKDRWVRGENIAQTFQFVRTGNADLGFVARSQILKDGKVQHGSAWLIPANMHQPIRQDAVLLKRGENSPAAKAFLRFVHSEEAQRVIQSYGYINANHVNANDVNANK